MGSTGDDFELSTEAHTGIWNAAGLVFGTTALTSLAPDVSPYLVGGVGSALSGLLAAGTAHVLAGDVAASGRARMLATVTAGVAGLGDTAWITYAQCTGHVNTFGQWATLAIGSAVGYGIARLFRLHIQRRAELLRNGYVPTEPARKGGLWETILAGAGVDAEVLDHGEFAAGLTATVRVPPKKLTGLFGSGVAEALSAAAASALPQHRIAPNAMVVTKGDTAGTGRLHLMIRDVLADTVDMPDDDTPASITDDILTSQYIDGRPVLLNLWRKHSEAIGATQSGKSSLINRILSHVTRCADAVVWLGSGWKLLDLVDPWITDLIERNQRLPFDWIAPDHDGLLAMLAAALQAADYRQRVPRALRPDRPTSAWPLILVVIDEASFALVRSEKILCHDGVRRTASELVDVLTKGATSAEVSVLLATQRGTVAHYGNEGGSIKNNIVNRFAFRSMDPNDLGRIIPDCTVGLSNTNLVHKGSHYAQLGAMVPMLAKAVYLSTDRIPAISAKRSVTAGRLDAGTAGAVTIAGNAYRDRWGSSPAEFLARLGTVGASVPAMAAATATTRGGGGDWVADAERDLRRTVAEARVRATLKASESAISDRFGELVGGLGDDVRDEPAGAAEGIADPAPATPPPGSLRDRIVAVIAAAGPDGIGRAGILAELPDANPGTVTNVLSALTTDAVVARVGAGPATRYVIPGGDVA